MHDSGRIRSAVLAAALLAGAAVSAVVASPAQAGDGPAINPAVEAARAATKDHRYRSGVTPTVDAQRQAEQRQASTSATSQYFYGMQHWGGTFNPGSGMTAAQVRYPTRVYVVYVGSGWGTASTDAQGDTVFSNDGAGLAKRQQQFYKGIGTNAENWSHTPTQYCDSNVYSRGDMECWLAREHHVAYPEGGVLAGVWYDASALPGTITSHDIAAEAIQAANHFGQINTAYNDHAQYIISYPPGASPDEWKKAGGGYNYCSWHGYNGDHSLTGGPIISQVGNVAFTVMPYLAEAGTLCGANLVNGGAAGALDGVSLNAGRQFQQTLVNPFPDWDSPTAKVPAQAGWIIPIYDSATNQVIDSSEYGAFCGWRPAGKAGGAFNLTLATGTFPVLGGWSNAAGDCVTGLAAVSSKPGVLYNPNNRNVEIYAVNGGNLAERYWNAGNGQWSIWNDFGGFDAAPDDHTKPGQPLTGDPAVFYNQNNRNVEIYAVTGGRLTERYWSASTGQWSGWADFGGTLTGSPKVFYNQNNRNVEIYGISNGQLVEKYWNAGNGQWSGWNNLGAPPANLVGDPAVLYNPNNRNIEIYANAGGTLVEKYWNASNGQWSGWNEFPGYFLNGSPAPFYNPNNRNIEIYVNAQGRLGEKFWIASMGFWSGWNDLGGSLSYDLLDRGSKRNTTPTVLYNPNNRNIEIYANANGQVTEKYWSAGTGQWSGWNGFGGDITGDPTVLYNPNNRNIEIYTAGGGHVQEKYWSAGNGQWSGWNVLTDIAFPTI